MMKTYAAALVLGFLIDLLIGDPRWLYHPVCITGNMIAYIEKKLRKFYKETPQDEKKAGFILVILICLYSFLVPALLLSILFRLSFWLGFALEVFWCYQLLATKCLKTESMKVYRALKTKDLEQSRYAVSMIVGRDTAELTEEGIRKATVETIAENTSDGVIAPMLYMAIGGVPLMYLYKGINTMDSMLGYKNEKYLNFGYAAAKLDDFANFLPARISALFMVLASFLCGLDGKGAWKIFKRDRRKHASPNSAQTESVTAGALGIELAGNAFYFGTLYEKPTIGDKKRAIADEDIVKTNRLMYVTAFLCCMLLTAILLAAYGLPVSL